MRRLVAVSMASTASGKVAISRTHPAQPCARAALRCCDWERKPFRFQVIVVAFEMVWLVAAPVLAFAAQKRAHPSYHQRAVASCCIFACALVCWAKCVVFRVCARHLAHAAELRAFRSLQPTVGTVAIFQLVLIKASRFIAVCIAKVFSCSCRSGCGRCCCSGGRHALPAKVRAANCSQDVYVAVVHLLLFTSNWVGTFALELANPANDRALELHHSGRRLAAAVVEVSFITVTRIRIWANADRGSGAGGLCRCGLCRCGCSRR